MTSRDFCFWLRGYLEIRKAEGARQDSINAEQVLVIERHLNLVSHEIDPSMGPKAVQAALNDIHSKAGALPAVLKPRC